MRDEDRAAWWAVWGMARCPKCSRLVAIKYAIDADHFSMHPLHPFDPNPMSPRCPQSGQPHEPDATIG